MLDKTSCFLEFLLFNVKILNQQQTFVSTIPISCSSCIFIHFSSMLCKIPKKVSYTVSSSRSQKCYNASIGNAMKTDNHENTANNTAPKQTDESHIDAATSVSFQSNNESLTVNKEQSGKRPSSKSSNSRLASNDLRSNRLRSLDDSARLTVDSLSDTSDRECRFWRTAASRISTLITSPEDAAKINLYTQQYGCIPPPFFVIVMSILQISVYAHYTVQGNIKVGWVTGCAGCIVHGNREGTMTFVSTRIFEIWRFISYCLVHQGLEQLLFNVLIQLVIGIPLEIVHKIWRIAPLYITAVVFSSVLHHLIDSEVVLVGASGGSYAILVAHLANVILTSNRLNTQIGKLISISVLVMFDFGHAIYRRYGLEDCEQKSYIAHAGGLFVGLLMHALFFRQFTRPRYQKILKYILPSIFFIWFLIGILLCALLKNDSSVLKVCNITEHISV
ncbi:Rhomboid-related protein 1 [Trichinella nativa]|uniref:Rhomboid-related protein 1 n=1 Tax=Trichinella nativa TaxID=6335 RepID=A0A0V1LV09_9BILA|nr:Rhomboid-related protein 1 [Trichinella nativa]